jgi:hypothetical protein
MLKLSALDFLIAVLACYRLAQFLSLDDGPGMIFQRLRQWSLSQQGALWGKSLAEFLECPYCQGVWFAGLLALWIVTPRNIIDWLVLTCALAGAQAFLQVMGDRQSDDNGANDGRHI